MKTLFFISAVVWTMFGFSQNEKMTCTGLPVARPDTKASISVEETIQKFESNLSEKLKKGTHSAVFKLVVDCNGDVTEVTYQRGTFSGLDQDEYKNQIASLKWKPAALKSKAVTSIVFVSIEIVNGRFTLVIQ
jgi:hypothetical protein